MEAEETTYSADSILFALPPRRTKHLAVDFSLHESRLRSVLLELLNAVLPVQIQGRAGYQRRFIVCRIAELEIEVSLSCGEYVCGRERGLGLGIALELLRGD